MPNYYYRARDGRGEPREGVQAAGSEEEVVRALERAQLVPVFIESRTPEATASRGQLFAGLNELIRRQRGRVKPVNVSLFMRQLATMTAAGLPVVRSLNSIGRDVPDKKLASVLAQVAEGVQSGESLSTAMSKHRGAFSDVIVSLVQTGELSGTLDKILDQTASYLERAETLRLRVRGAMLYPIVVSIIMVGVLAGMLLGVVPMFAEIYGRFRVPLPVPTRVLLAVSSTLVHNLPLVLILVLGLVFGLTYAGNTPSGRVWIDRVRFRLPLFGSVIRLYAVSRFTRALGILTASGTQILQALKVIGPISGNKVVERGIDRMRSRVEEGSSLANAMEETGVFPEMLVQMTGTGEETGELDTMLSRTADFYEQRLSAKVDSLSSLIEPITVILLGAMIAVMLLALYFPIFNLGQAMRSGLGSP